MGLEEVPDKRKIFTRAQFAAILKLGRAERLQLVEDLWDSIAEEDAQLPVPEWKREELRRRKQRDTS